MKKITKNDLNNNYYSRQINRMTVLTSSELSLSAILGGFSLGAVVALLLIDTSSLVRGMFVLSIISSCLFILSVIYHQGILGDIQDMIVYLDLFESKKEKFMAFKKINIHSAVASVMFLIGLLCFWSVLICACFMYTSIFGIIMLLFFVPLLLFVIKKIMNSTDSEQIDWFSDYDNIPE